MPTPCLCLLYRVRTLQISKQNWNFFLYKECDKHKKIQLVTLIKQPVFFYTKAFVYNCEANCLAIVKLSRHIIKTP